MIIRLVIGTLTAAAVLCAFPAAAHHNSVDPEFVETKMPEDALDAHNTAVDNVLLRLDEMGISTMDGNQSGNVNMDPADVQQGAGCAAVIDGICDDDLGNDAPTASGGGMASGVEGGMSRAPAPLPVP